MQALCSTCYETAANGICTHWSTSVSCVVLRDLITMFIIILILVVCVRISEYIKKRKRKKTRANAK